MKTALQELISVIPDAREIMEFISEVQPDEKMLDEWLWDRLYKGRNWLEKEKEQIINAHLEGWSDAYDYLKSDSNDQARQAEDYFNQTYNN